MLLCENGSENLIEHTNVCHVQVAMTDCDTKERKALDAVFPGIKLLICLWHQANAVNNKMRTDLGSGGDADVQARRKQVRFELRKLVQR